MIRHTSCALAAARSCSRPTGRLSRCLSVSVSAYKEDAAKQQPKVSSRLTVQQAFDSASCVTPLNPPFAAHL